MGVIGEHMKKWLVLECQSAHLGGCSDLSTIAHIESEALNA